VRCVADLRQSGCDVRVGELRDSAAFEVVAFPSFFTPQVDGDDAQLAALTADVASLRQQLRSLGLIG